MHSNFLIIGSSAAAMGALSKLRALAPKASITCLTAEPDMPYNRCLLADLIADSRPQDAMYTKKADFFATNDITLHLDSKAISIDPKAKQVTTQAGKIYSYNKLFWGTGKSATTPPIPGIDANNVFPFFDLKEAVTIKALANKPEVTNIVVVGAGLTGLECADALTESGKNIALIERGNQVLPSQIDKHGATFIETLVARAGVTLLKNKALKKINHTDNQANNVELTDGTQLPADLIIFATGGTPNLAPAHTAGLATQDKGLVVNEQMQTSNPDIFAGGDICVVNDLLTGGKVLSCLWPDAMMQGMVAASNMAGKTRNYPGALIITSSHIFDTTFVTCGPVMQAERYQALVKQDNDFYHRLLLGSEGTLQGFVMVGNVSSVGQLRKAVLEKQVIAPPHK